jgi:hypothetical protein
LKNRARKKRARKTQEKLHKFRRKGKNTSADGVKRAQFDGQIV